MSDHDQNTEQVKADESLKSPVHLHTILVPTDFSHESYRAIQYARSLAQVFHSKVTLLHVLVPVAAPDLVYGPLVWDEGKAEEAAGKQLERLKEKAHFFSETEVHCLVKTGHPFQVVSDTAQENNTDLIIISTHGYTGFKHLLLGSVAERVIRHATCPVLVVREKEHEFITIDEDDPTASEG